MADACKLRVAGLVKRFGGLTATDQASFEVRAGEMHALIGPNGAGKTTLIHQISGALRPDAGRISMDGADITQLPMYRRVRLGLARSYQITSVFKAFSVLDNVAMAVQARTGGAAGCWRPVRPSPTPRRSRRKAAATPRRRRPWRSPANPASPVR